MPFRPFFLPSPEITNQLMISMGRRRAGILRRAAAEEIEASESDELVSSVLAALENEPEHSPEHDWEDQRWLSDIVYHLLGRMAGRARRQGAQRFPTTEAALIEGMRTSLGLYEPQDMPSLEELAAEFSSWLSKQPHQTYPAGWGRIVKNLFGTNVFYLEPFEREASASEIGTLTVATEREQLTDFAEDSSTRTHEAATSSSS